MAISNLNHNNNQKKVEINCQLINDKQFSSMRGGGGSGEYEESVSQIIIIVDDHG